MQRKYLILLTMLAFLLIGSGLYLDRGSIRKRFTNDQPASLPPAVNANVSVANSNQAITNGNRNAAVANANRVTNTSVQLPSEYNLNVPFVQQAPTANWDAVHEEMCEEAAALTVHYFWQGVSSPIAPQIETQFSTIMAYENTTFGDYKDTTAAQTAQFINAVWGYKRVEVVPMHSLEDAQQQVFAGRPVIIPSAGKLLENPNFKNGGPLYHNLVIRGWLQDGRIITNDPGTRKGNGYVYDADVLWNAIHDWNGGDVTNGAKVMIVVYPN